jgi:hypothetical protein
VSTTVDPSTTTTTADPDTGSTGAGSGESADESTGDVPSVCEPQPQMIRAEIDANPEIFDEYFVDDTCIVLSVEMTEPDRQRIELTCGKELGSPQTIEIRADPFVDIGLAPNQEIGLRIAESVPIDFGGYEFVAIRNVKGELLAAMYGEMNPPENVDEATWFAPFTAELRTDVCDPEPYIPPDGNLIQDPCPSQRQRAAFELTAADESLLVHDGTLASLAGYDIYVPYAAVLHPQDFDLCGPRPYTIARFVILRAPR